LRFGCASDDSLITGKGVAAHSVSYLEPHIMHLRVYRAFVIAVIVVYPLAYFGMFAGDAEIHLKFAENAARGLFFEYNPGEKTAGVTSTGYMLFLSLLFRLAPEGVIPLLVVLLDYAGWYLLVYLTWQLLKRATTNPILILAGTLIAGLLPGSAYNSVVGMENVFFGDLVLILTCLALRWDLLSFESGTPSLGRTAWRGGALGCIAGLSFWMRPEGLFFLSLLAIYSASVARRKRANFVLLFSAVPACTISCAFLLTLLLFHHKMTGRVLPGSAQSRMIMGTLDGFQLGPIPITLKFAGRLAEYFPITLLALAGVWASLRKWKRGENPPSLFYSLVFFIFFVLYSTFLGSAHLGRYTIFLMPFVVVLAVIAMEHALVWRATLSSRGRRTFNIVVAAMALSQASVFLMETRIRLRLGSHQEMALAMGAPQHRRAASDELMMRLGNPPAPVSLAYQEVQARYFLDDRFVVRSLDGRTDPVMLRYCHDGYFDHVGYIKERRVQYLMELPNYNRDPRAWSLEQLRTLKPGASVERDGVAFTRLGFGDTVHITLNP
jgi:hypothetical protein